MENSIYKSAFEARDLLQGFRESNWKRYKETNGSYGFIQNSTSDQQLLTIVLLLDYICATTVKLPAAETMSDAAASTQTSRTIDFDTLFEPGKIYASEAQPSEGAPDSTKPREATRYEFNYYFNEVTVHIVGDEKGALGLDIYKDNKLYVSKNLRYKLDVPPPRS